MLSTLGSRVGGTIITIAGGGFAGSAADVTVEFDNDVSSAICCVNQGQICYCFFLNPLYIFLLIFLFFFFPLGKYSKIFKI